MRKSITKAPKVYRANIRYRDDDNILHDAYEIFSSASLSKARAIAKSEWHHPELRRWVNWVREVQ